MSRILAVLQTIDGIITVGGVKSVFRNRAVVENEYRPAIVLLDGRQEKLTTTTGRSRMPMVNMRLLPQIFVLLQLRENIKNEGVGEELSAFETKVLVALFTDGQLWELLGGESGAIEYESLDTDMQTGSSMEGQQQLGVAFTYIFDPDELIN